MGYPCLISPRYINEAEAMILQITLSDDTEDEMKKIATVLERNSLAIVD